PAFASAAGNADSPERDAQLVYCLDPVHRADLLTAAVRLGLLKANATVSPEQWAKDKGDDFGRACAALMAAESDSPGTAAQAKGANEDSWFMGLVKQFPLLLLGALLPLAGQSYERVSSQRRELRQELGARESAYRMAVREYLTAYEEDERADYSAVRAARDALAVALSRVPGPAVRRAAAEELAEGLPLAEPLPHSGGQYLLDTATRTHDAAEVHASVIARLQALPRLNRGLMYWGWRTVRTRPDHAGPVAAAGASGGGE
ncbi:hypothetical protein, partial [Streptomyces graminilatus]|uniref:hypothetical protein n=1 Tax=Streptomyces graminilatus TaxID=1464070 RepID=UPI000AA09525